MNIASTISGLLEDSMRRFPDAMAILAPGRTGLTYAQLNESVCALGSRLAGMGIGRADRVAIVLPNGPEMALAFLASAACAASAPLNPAYGTSEFEFYLSDLDARLLIVEAGSSSPAVSVAASRGIPVLEFDMARFSGEAVAMTPAHAEDVALILHTSGTTSRPKMVPLTQRNLCLSAWNIAKWFSLTPNDRCLNIMPLFHIHGLVGAVLSSLAAGASVVCTPGLDAARWFGWMSEFQPTWYTAVPTMHQAILARVSQHMEALARNPLRFIRSCSSALPPKLMEELEAAFHAPVLESYGMTEASHQIASNPLPPRKHKPGSVGMAAGPEVAIMDGEGNLLPGGQTGEIVLRGPTITRGYELNPEANRKGFTNGWFRTGDEGRIDDEGYIFISARIKEIINRGGEKISPREIDEVLLQHPDVSQSVAFPVPHAQLGEDVGATVVLKAGSRATESDLRRFAASRLAYFKVPRIILLVDEIPKGATGKIQRIGMAERLKIEPIDDSVIPRAEFRKPSSSLEKELQSIWGEILGMQNIGVDDSFFALGGNSILATSLMVRLARDYGARLSIVDFMDAPTIAGIARTMERDANGSAAEGSHLLVAVQTHGTRPSLYCAPGRDGVLLGFWNLSRRLGPDQPIYAFAANRAAGSNPPITIEEMASACIKLMRARQPYGPYFLLGNCFGGFVTYEMAQQLSRDGERVPLLVMLDCYNHEWRRDLPFMSLCTHKARHALVRTRFHWTNLRLMSAKQRVCYFKERFAKFRHETRVRELQRLYDLSVRRRKPAPRIVSDIAYSNRWAEQVYQRRPYSGRILLISTTDPAGGIYPAPLMGWQKLFQGPVDAFDVAGDHLRMLFEPAVDKVSDLIKNATDPT